MVRNHVVTNVCQGVFDFSNGEACILSTVRNLSDPLTAEHLHEQADEVITPDSAVEPTIDESTACLAHEIRNSLASIKGVADAFLQRGQLSCQEREWMEAVRREVLKIDTRMREMPNVSHSRRFNIKPCSLSEIVNGVVLLAACQVNSINEDTARKVSIRFIDETTEPLILHIDPARIEDAILNLILNAIESIDKNGRVTVCLRCVSKSLTGDGEALIEVSDTGSGISPEIRQRIFEPHFTTKQKGTGLGLAAVRRTAAAHCGRLSFNTRIGRGSRFVLALPLRTLIKSSMRIRH